MLNKSNIAGVNLGSKLAGATSLCFFHDNQLHFETSRRGQDADDMMYYYLKNSSLKSVFINAPLSLPGIYFDSETYTDFFYRICDAELGAMSPMVLGSMTARAMKLKYTFESQIDFYETHPSYLAKEMNLLNMGYKGEMVYINKCYYEIKKHYEINVFKKPTSWFEIDALLGWISAYRFLVETHQVFGEENEGLIYV